MKAHIAFCPHFHQPYFQLYSIREQAFNNCYVPFLELLEEMANEPGFYINLHYSGPFLSWVVQEKSWYVERLRKVVKQPGIGLIGGLVDEPFIQLSSRVDDVLFQIQAYEKMIWTHLGIKAAEWEGIHVVEREAGEWLLSNLAHAAKVIGAQPVIYLDAETFFEPHFSYPGGDNDYCRRVFGFDDAYSRTTVPHLPPELLFFPMRDEIGGNELFIFPIHAPFRYRLLKRRAFSEMDREVVKPSQYVFYIKDAAQKAHRLAKRLGRDIEPIIVIFEDGEKFGEWSKDPVGDTRWLKEFFHLVRKDPELQFSGLRSHLEKTGYLSTYPVSTSHSYPEWENWTAQRGIRGLNYGDERLQKVIARHRDIEDKLEDLERYLLSCWDLTERIPSQLLQDLVLNSLRRSEIIELILDERYPARLKRAYLAVRRVRNLVYQEDPRWASRHPSYGSSGYFDLQGLGYLELAERLLDLMAAEIKGEPCQFPEVEVRDWDGDGEKEVIIRTPYQIVVISCWSGEVLFQQAFSERMQGFTQLLTILERETSLPLAYSEISKDSYPLILTEADSELREEFGSEGERVERCRNSFRVTLWWGKEDELTLLPQDPGGYRLEGVECNRGKATIKLVKDMEVNQSDHSLSLTITKVFTVEKQALLMSVEAQAPELDDSGALYLVPELVTSAVPSDEIYFLPYCWVGITGGGKGMAVYDFNIAQGIKSPATCQSIWLPIPKQIAYVYNIRNGRYREYTNTLYWDLKASRNLERVEIKPAVGYYYRNHVFPGPSRLGYCASGMMIRPHVRLVEGQAGFSARMSWRFGSAPSIHDFEYSVDLLGCQDNLNEQKIDAGGVNNDTGRVL